MIAIYYPRRCACCRENRTSAHRQGIVDSWAAPNWCAVGGSSLQSLPSKKKKKQQLIVAPFATHVCLSFYSQGVQCCNSDRRRTGMNEEGGAATKMMVGTSGRANKVRWTFRKHGASPKQHKDATPQGQLLLKQTIRISKSLYHPTQFSSPG